MRLLHIIRAHCSCYTSHPDGVPIHDKRSHIQAKITKPAPHTHTLSYMSCKSVATLVVMYSHDFTMI